MNKTPLYRYHEKQDAQFVDFSGWQLPIRYTSIIEEHNACRNLGGLFDVSHMGRVKFTGRHARKFLERVLTRRITNMKPGQCRYALVCNEQGYALDDVIVYRFEEHWMLVVNASNREKLLAHFDAVKAAEEMAVTIEDETESTAMLPIQGPKVMDIIGKFSSEVPTLKRYHFCLKNLMIVKLIVSRTGYTGENGVEIIFNAKHTDMILKLLLGMNKEAKQITPCGLGARDTLRLEAGMPLYGHELDENTTPLEAGLSFAVNLDKGEEEEGSGPKIPTFIGQEALKSHTPTKQLIGLTLDGKRTPRQGAKVLVNDDAIGEVTSGCMSPTLGHPIAMAYIKPDSAKIGDTVQIDLGRQTIEATVSALPFYKAS